MSWTSAGDPCDSVAAAFMNSNLKKMVVEFAEKYGW